MKILLINDYGTPTGGAEIVTLALRDRLRARGHDARLFASRAQPLRTPILADYTCFGTAGRLQTLLGPANPFAYRQLRRVLNSFQPDVVHLSLFLSQLSPLILPLLRETPTVYRISSYEPICPMGNKLLPDGSLCRFPPGPSCRRCLPLRSWVLLILQQHLWRHLGKKSIDTTVTISRTARSALVRGGIPIDRVILNGVPLREMRPPLSAPPLIGFCGRLTPEKGTEVLLRAFTRVLRKLPQARLAIVGYGPEEDRLKRLSRETCAGDAVSFYGYLPREEMEFRFTNAWVQVVPTLCQETFGNVVAEAMMRGTAVVVSDSGGPCEYVDHGRTGFIAPAGDVTKLAEILEHLLTHPDKIEGVGQAAHAFAKKRLSMESMVEKYEAIYETLPQKQKNLDRQGKIA